MARRLDGQGSGYDETTRYTEKRGIDWTGVVKCHPGRLEEPLRWRKRRRVFVNSMSDLFHPTVPRGFIDRVFAVMSEAKRHTFQILTKRPELMREYMAAGEELWNERWPEALREVSGKATFFGGFPENVWLGTSIEDDEVLGRADDIRAIKEPEVRFLSLEPLIGPLPGLDLSGIEWVIVGGESGPGARAMEKEWVTDIRDQCREADVLFFFKQWGGVRKKEAGRTLNGRMWDEMPPMLELAKA
jgi:protein gp37